MLRSVVGRSCRTLEGRPSVLQGVDSRDLSVPVVTTICKVINVVIKELGECYCDKAMGDLNKREICREARLHTETFEKLFQKLRIVSLEELLPPASAAARVGRECRIPPSVPIGARQTSVQMPQRRKTPDSRCMRSSYSCCRCQTGTGQYLGPRVSNVSKQILLETRHSNKKAVRLFDVPVRWVS